MVADRLTANRPATSSLVCLDSQRVRLAPRMYEHRGLNEGNRVNGCKRQIVTPVLSRSLACRVHAASGHAGGHALHLLPARPRWGQRLLPVVTNKSYRGRSARRYHRLGLPHQVGSCPPSAERGFVSVSPRGRLEARRQSLRGKATSCRRVP